MTIVVEDGTGLPNAESYGSVDDFKSHWQKFGNPDEATDATEAEIEEALRESAQYLEITYNQSFRGCSLTLVQAFHFPIKSTAETGQRYDSNGRLGDPFPIRYLHPAQFEIGLRILQSVDIFTPDQVGGVGKIIKIKEKVAPIAEEIEYSADGLDLVTIFSKVDQILRPILISQQGSVIR